MSKFTPGDVVRLKSGGPFLTVLEEVIVQGQYEMVDCRWMDYQGKYHQNNFWPVTLIKMGEP